ncbi:MAG: UDP-N-acetylmuramoyl-L-alanine--D-glutamate ligase [Actinomycetota bacterium]
MNAFAGERVVVVGAGTSGRAAARALAEEGARVLVTERGSIADDDALRALGVEMATGGHRPEHLDGASLVVTSPGVAQSAEVLGWARERGLPIWSELELGARLCTVPYVGITGTNGKTTTTEIVAASLRATGLDAIACGNIGHPFSLAAREARDALAVEASSFQLHFSQTFRPRVSALLNVADDHLDWHGSRRAYVEAKARIFELQAGDDVHVGNADDEEAARVSRTARCRVVWFRLGPPADQEVGFVDGDLVSRLGGEPEVHIGRPASETGGFRADAAAATAVALSYGVPAEAIREALLQVRPLPHRGSTVATVDGVRFVDDSKATNPHAALAALDGLRDVVLIAGGRSKGVDLSPLGEAAGRLSGVVAIGEAAGEIAEIFAGRVPAVHRAGSIEEAVRAAVDQAVSGGTVLLAPACASQDMFTDYRERGDRFAAAARSLQEERSVG